jgi:phosphatidylinositol alpha 1,6-mannosyltransferase
MVSMRVALFAESFLPKVDGVTNTLCYLLDHLAQRGCQSLLFCPAGAPGRYARTQIVGLSSFAFPWYPELKLVPPLVRVREELEAFCPDIVHLVNPALLGLAGLREARTLDLPVVASYHTDIPGYAGRYGWGVLVEPLWSYFRWLHNQADLNYCPSSYTAIELEEHGFERLKVWPHGVDTNRFAPSWRSDAGAGPDTRERLTEGHPEAPLLLYVGRLAREKRAHWLKPLIDALPGARLAIVGDGPAREELSKLMAGTPTVFTGYLRGAELSRAYASADLFVFPSANETFGNVMLEAMASALPVIAPRSGGPVDHVRDGYNGYLFDAESCPAFIAAVRRVLDDPAHRQEMGAQALAYARSQSWEAILDDLLCDFQELIDAHRRASQQRQTAEALRWDAVRQAYAEYVGMFMDEN